MRQPSSDLVAECPFVGLCHHTGPHVRLHVQHVLVEEHPEDPPVLVPQQFIAPRHQASLFGDGDDTRLHVVMSAYLQVMRVDPDTSNGYGVASGMPNITKAVVSLQHTSGLPEDVSQNTFYFTGVSGAGDETTLFGLLEDFYNVDAPTEGGNIAELLSTRVSRAADAHRIELFDAQAGGSPFAQNEWTLGAAYQPTQGDFPDEVAICLSFHGSYDGLPEESGLTRPRSRRRGRVYIGPVTGNAGLAGVVIPAVQQRIAQVGARLRADALAAGMPWVVYSSTSDIAHQVVEGWVDDAFDIQRRRGRKASSRYYMVGGAFG